MKKTFAFLFITLMLAACSEDNSTDAFGNNGSSSIESPSDNWITIEKTDHFSFFDEKHLRYYFLEEECDYDSATNSFKWVTENYTNFLDRYEVTNFVPIRIWRRHS